MAFSFNILVISWFWNRIVTKSAPGMAARQTL